MVVFECADALDHSFNILDGALLLEVLDLLPDLVWDRVGGSDGMEALGQSILCQKRSLLRIPLAFKFILLVEEFLQ